MSLLKQITKKAAQKELIEDAAAGATSAGAVAGFRAPIGGTSEKTKMVRRNIPKAFSSEEEEKETDWNKEVADFRKRAKKDKGESRRRKPMRRRMAGPSGNAFSLTFENAVNELNEGMEDEKFDPSDVISKLRAANARADNEQDTTGFALEDSDGRIVKVYVASAEAEEFEKALGAQLTGEDEDDDNETTPLEIAEVLFKLKDRFAIVDVVWPPVNGDPEEQESTDELDVEVDAEGEGEDLEGEGDEEMDMEADLEDEDGDGEVDGESEAAGALSSLVDLLKSQADAQRAEAQAREAEANAEEAKFNAQAAEAKVKREEEILDMEAHQDQQKKEEQEAKKLKDLARFRHEQAQGSDVDEESEEDKIPGSIPGEEIPGNKFEPGFDENRNRRMEPGELIKYILQFQRGQ